MLLIIIPCLLMSSAHAQSCGRVTFAASISSRVVVESDSIIRYDNVHAGSHPAYDASTGVFTCPAEAQGLYFFNLTGTCGNQLDRACSYNLAIFKNGSRHQDSVTGVKNWIYARNDTSVLHWLDVGDKVYVRSDKYSYKYSDRYLYPYLDEGDGNTFSGFLLPVPRDPVTFAAHLSTPVTANYGETIRYGDVIVDSDAAYDPSTGVFTCPTQGLYFFNVTGTSHKQPEPFFMLSIYKNGKSLLDWIASGPMSKDRSGTGNVVSWMNVGDKVKVMSQYSASSLDAGAGSSFSGFRLVINADRPVTFAANVSSRIIAERVNETNNRGPYVSFDRTPTVLYDNVQAATDAAYNGSTGVFTCRTQGLYFFHVKVMCNGRISSPYSWRIAIYKNGEYQDKMYFCGLGSSTSYETSGIGSDDPDMSIVRWLNEGDEVLTEVDEGGASGGYPGEGSSFSGFRLPMVGDSCHSSLLIK